jgi:hypothetical protein
LTAKRNLTIKESVIVSMAQCKIGLKIKLKKPIKKIYLKRAIYFAFAIPLN